MSTLDIGAYFRRIGYDGARTPSLDVLRGLQRRHTASVPFENLSPLLGHGVPIDLPSLEDKIVCRRRGGYCFEQNGLFLGVLRALGFRVTPLAGRVVWMMEPGAVRPPLSHMLLQVHLPEGDRLADVGFGGQTPVQPLLLQADIEQKTPMGIYRLRNEGNAFVQEMKLPERWEPMYRFTLAEQTPRDYESFNWFTSTHPTSRFTNNLIAARIEGDARHILFNREAAIHRLDGTSERRALTTPEEAHALLSSEFGLDVALDELAGVWPRIPL